MIWLKPDAEGVQLMVAEETAAFIRRITTPFTAEFLKLRVEEELARRGVEFDGRLEHYVRNLDLVVQTGAPDVKSGKILRRGRRDTWCEKEELYWTEKTGAGNAGI